MISLPCGGRTDGSFPNAKLREHAAKYRSTPVNHLKLFAFDAGTGRQLYSSEKLVTEAAASRAVSGAGVAKSVHTEG
jgi:hypothetical protein